MVDSAIRLKGIGEQIVGNRRIDVNLTIFFYKFGRATSDHHALTPLIEYLCNAGQQLGLVEALVETDSDITRCELTWVTWQTPRNAFRFVVKGSVYIPCTSCLIL